MFDVYCPGHRSRVLLDATRIETIHNTADGPVVAWRCWCGSRGSALQRRATRPARTFGDAA